MKIKPFHAHDKAAITRVVGRWACKPGRFKSAQHLSWCRAMRRAGAR